VPDVVHAWSIELPIEDEVGIAFTEDEAAKLALTMMLPSMAELKGADGGAKGEGCL